jgi:hypothetical protein
MFDEHAFRFGHRQEKLMEALFIIFPEGAQLATRTIFELYFLRVMKQFKFQRHRFCCSGSEMNVAKCRIKGKSA